MKYCSNCDSVMVFQGREQKGETTAVVGVNAGGRVQWWAMGLIAGKVTARLDKHYIVSLDDNIPKSHFKSSPSVWSRVATTPRIMTFLQVQIYDHPPKL